MIDALLGKIAGFFEKDFLFASLLPALIFLPCVAAALAAAAGVDAVWAWVESWTATQKVALSVASSLLIVVFAYVLHALRTAFAQFWTGSSRFPLLWGFKHLGETVQQARYRRMRARASRLSPWEDEFENFRGKVAAAWRDTGEIFTPESEWKLMKLVRSLRKKMGAAAVRERLEGIVAAYGSYPGEDLKNVYFAVKQQLSDWNDAEEVRIQTDTYALDRQFGTLETVKATTLGNITESYKQYSYKRYRMEADIFWPRLRSVMPAPYLALVQEPQILLDFSLTAASLSGVYAFFALLVGPWLWFNQLLWCWLAGVALFNSYLFYRLGVLSANQLGELVRSSFDLFRLDLMSALGRPLPPTFYSERAQWEELSRLAVYGTVRDFALQPKPEKTPEE
jgi:hypothetical protein